MSTKYSIKVPTSVKETLKLDKETKNNLWREAIITEMKNNRVALNILKEGRKVRPERKSVECFMCFEVKIGFRRRAGYVVNTAKTPDLSVSS